MCSDQRAPFPGLAFPWGVHVLPATPRSLSCPLWASRAVAEVRSYSGPEGTWILCQLLLFKCCDSKGKRKIIQLLSFHEGSIYIISFNPHNHPAWRCSPLYRGGHEVGRSKCWPKVNPNHVCPVPESTLFALPGCLSGAGWGFLFRVSPSSSFPRGCRGDF